MPFTVELSAALFPGVDYSDWAMCYSVATATVTITKSFCVTIVVEEGTVSFEPLVKDALPPSLDGLNSTTQHRVDAWFESRKERGGEGENGSEQRWGALTSPFAVAPTPPLHRDGITPKILADDAGSFETEQHVIILDGALDISDYPGNIHEKFKTTPTVAGVLIEATDDTPATVVAAIANVLKNMPAVRPIHLFHGLSLLQACLGSHVYGGIDLSDLAVHSNSSGASSGASSSHIEVSSSDFEARAALCDLVAAEAVVPHALTVDRLSPRGYGHLLRSRVFWARLQGSDKALFFSSNGAACSSDSHKARPRLVRDFAAKFDLVSCGGGSAEKWGYSQLDVELQGCGGGWSLRDVGLMGLCANEFGLGVGDEPESTFFRRCTIAQKRRVANESEARQFCGGGGGSLVAFEPSPEELPGLLAACPEYAAIANQRSGRLSDEEESNL